jgi:hypothetical protein
VCDGVRTVRCPQALPIHPRGIAKAPAPRWAIHQEAVVESTTRSLTRAVLSARSCAVRSGERCALRRALCAETCAMRSVVRCALSGALSARSCAERSVVRCALSAQSCTQRSVMRRVLPSRSVPLASASGSHPQPISWCACHLALAHGEPGHAAVGIRHSPAGGRQRQSGRDLAPLEGVYRACHHDGYPHQQPE